MGVTAAVGVLAMGTATSAYGSVKAGNDAKDIYGRNALIGEWQAQDAEVRGRIDEKKMRRVTEGKIGSLRTSLAAQGVDVNKGSALDVQADAAYLGELDALTIRNNARKEAWGYRVQADDMRNRGSIAQREGTFGAFETVVGSAGSLLLAKYGGGSRRATTPVNVGNI